jgi:hypothetical protein
MEIQHNNPAWRHKADYVIGAKITDPVWSKRYSSEQLAAKELEDGRFEICCIPFMVYDLCLGDIVVLDKEGNIAKVVDPSGHFGFRVATDNKSDQDWIIDHMYKAGQLTERYSDKICAIDTEDELTASEISRRLASAEHSGHIVQYETIRR